MFLCENCVNHKSNICNRKTNKNKVGEFTDLYNKTKYTVIRFEVMHFII